MRIGKLRHRVTIEEPLRTQNEYGEPVTIWLPVYTTYAAKEDLAGREYFAGQTTKSEVTTRFRIRYKDGLHSTMRVYHDGEHYDIQAVQDPDGYRRELILMTKLN